MTVLEGRKLGFEFLVLEEKPDSPACKVADACFSYDKVDEFLRWCHVVTFEFEHIPDYILEKVYPVALPSVEVLELKKSRIKEKSFYKRMGYPVPSFRIAQGKELPSLLRDVCLPVVVKRDVMGYDGKGQYVVNHPQDAQVIATSYPHEWFLVEDWVDFAMEFSIIGVRDKSGRVLLYPPTVNFHQQGILLYNKTASLEVKEAQDILHHLMEDLGIVGVLAVEFFYTKDGKVLINEMAPRVHNTGHYTLDGCYTSQFENLVRAVTGLPLGSTSLKCPAGMVNILGLGLEDLDLHFLLSVEGAKLYWYSKSKKPRRKMGHINVVGRTEEEVEYKINRLLEMYHVLEEK